MAVFIASGVALSVFMTWLFVNARQSVLISGVIPHAIANAHGQSSDAFMGDWIHAAVMSVGALLLALVFGPQLQRRA